MKRKENSQGRDPRTREENSQGRDPRTREPKSTALCRQEKSRVPTAGGQVRTTPRVTRGGVTAVATAVLSARNTWKQPEQERERVPREGWSTRQHVETTRVSQRRSLGEELEHICPGQVQPDHHHRREEGGLLKCEIQINVQSLDIAGGVNAGKDDLDVGAGEQDIKFDYASDETHSMTTRLERN